MKLDFARRCAERLVERLTPHCTRVSVAGSVRRAKPECADIDLVVIPTRTVERDIFGNVIRSLNTTWLVVDGWISGEKWQVRQAGAQIVSFISGGVQVDLFWCEPETWGTTLLCRTGSKEHNIWLANRAIAAGGKWHPNDGLYLSHRKLAATEEEIYGALGLAWIEPAQREAHLLPHATLCRPGMGAALRGTR